MENTDKKVLNKSILILLILVALFILLILVAGKNRNEGEATVTRNVGKQAIINLNGHNLVASVADSARTREQGLAGVHYLNDQSGMWFVFEEADEHAFWMKGTKVALDMAWVSSVGTIVHIEENVLPESYPKVFTSPVPAQYVLEVNAGYFERNGIEVGDTIVATPITPAKN